MTELRAYYFGNLYMSSIQQGIQSLHTTAEMFIKYSVDYTPQTKMLDDWATDHKTVILKQAGYSSDQHEIVELLKDETNPYPWSSFSEEGVDNALTCVGIILPEKVYDTADQVRRMPYHKRDKFLADAGLSKFELKLVSVIIETSLAR